MRWIIRSRVACKICYIGQAFKVSRRNPNGVADSQTINKFNRAPKKRVKWPRQTERSWILLLLTPLGTFIIAVDLIHSALYARWNWTEGQPAWISVWMDKGMYNFTQISRFWSRIHSFAERLIRCTRRRRSMTSLGTARPLSAPWLPVESQRSRVIRWVL